MKERPIIFSAPMVRAILADSKTMTRRIVKGAPGSVAWNQIVLRGHGGWCDEHGRAVKCPYGKPGDRLWVRETWMPDMPRDGTWSDVEFFGCGMRPFSLIPKKYRKAKHCLFRATYEHDLTGWKPSIHMPRWASRITLEIVSVRVERLQEVSEEDARAEGVEPLAGDGPNRWSISFNGFALNAPTARGVFQILWDTINGPESWDANPFVWVIEFKRLPEGGEG